MADVTLWDDAGLHVWVSWGAEGQLIFHGQHLTGGAEYEYAISVPQQDVPTLVAALGGPPGVDVIELVRANGESIVRQGEQAWITSLGITPGFWAHASD